MLPIIKSENALKIQFNAPVSNNTNIIKKLHLRIKTINLLSYRQNAAIILNPSNGYKGNKLNTAKNKFVYAKN